MKLDAGRPPKGPKRKPLRTFNEMAEEFGLTPGELNGYRMTHPTGYPGSIPGLGNLHRHYFDPDLMRAWWKSVLAIKNKGDSHEN